MRNLLAFLAAVTLTVLGLGWYLDWYKVRTNLGSSGHRNVTIDIDTVKFEDDVSKGTTKFQELLEKSRKEQAAQLAKEKEAKETEAAGKDGKMPEEKPKPEEKPATPRGEGNGAPPHSLSEHDRSVPKAPSPR
jgi:hypothetical protein